MSRKKRNRNRSRHNNARLDAASKRNGRAVHPNTQPKTEDYSASYEAGNTVKYNNRIKGPTFPVTTTQMAPEDMN